jgi:hypothetical protein
MNLDRMWAVSGWLLVTGGLAAVVWGSMAPLRSPSPAAARFAAQPRRSAPAPSPAESLADKVAAGDLFRADRHPAAVAYDPGHSSSPVAIAPAPIRPVLILSGLVWGPAPAAVIEGLPGTDGSRVLHAGDIVGGLRLIRIRVEGVVIAGMDTTWTLKVRNPWP